MKNVFTSCFIAFFLITIISYNSCSGRSRNGERASEETLTDAKNTIDNSDSETNVTPIINVYIENSGSMDGYVNGNTEFKGAIRDLLVLLKHYYGQEENIKIHFINSEIRRTDTKVDLATFAQNINTYWKTSGGNKNSSSLNNVFKMILNKTDEKTISILFSDCIYSIDGKNAEDLLSDAKSLTKDAFLSRWRVDSLHLATTIVKMKSKFTGTYYDKDNKKTSLSEDERPYYICVIGSDNLMLDFNSKIKMEKGKIEGFDNKYIISSGEIETPYYSTLLATENVGRFKPTRTMSTKEYIHGIEDISMPSNNRGAGGSDKLTFAVAIDIKNVPVEDDYLLNIENYRLNNNNFKIKEIKSIDGNNGIDPTDWNRVNAANPTHIIVLEATGTALSDITVSLTKQVPQWIEQTNIIDDKKIKDNLDKTFGIKYLIEGIAEAYQIIYPHDKNFFEFSISIKP